MTKSWEGRFKTSDHMLPWSNPRIPRFLIPPSPAPILDHFRSAYGHSMIRQKVCSASPTWIVAWLIMKIDNQSFKLLLTGAFVTRPNYLTSDGMKEKKEFYRVEDTDTRKILMLLRLGCALQIWITTRTNLLQNQGASAASGSDWKQKGFKVAPKEWLAKQHYH